MKEMTTGVTRNSRALRIYAQAMKLYHRVSITGALGLLGTAVLLAGCSGANSDSTASTPGHQWDRHQCLLRKHVCDWHTSPEYVDDQGAGDRGVVGKHLCGQRAGPDPVHIRALDTADPFGIRQARGRRSMRRSARRGHAVCAGQAVRDVGHHRLQ